MATKKWPRGISLRTEGTGASKIWRASIGKKFDGAARRQAFKSHSEGITWLENEIGKHEQNQADLKVTAAKLDLTPNQLADARLAFAKLAGRATLLESATAWIDHVEPTKQVPTVADAISKLITEKRNEGLTETHVHDLEKRLTSFFRFFGSKRVNALRRIDMFRALKVKMGPPKKKVPPSPAQQEKRLRYASILINFSITQDWIQAEKNPLKNLNPTKRVMKRVGFLTYEQIARLLCTALEMRPSLIPMLALKVFSGIRNAECFRLTWADVEDKQIEVLAAYAKTGRYRPIKIHSTLAEWLIGQTRNPEDFVFGINPKTKNREACWLWHFTPIWKAALPEVKVWPRNALRHTFGSHFYARTKSISETAYEMGNSEAVVKRHYLNAVSDDKCARFWRLIPASAEAVSYKSPFQEQSDKEKPDPPEPI